MWLLKIPVTVVTVTQKVEAVNHQRPEVNRATNHNPRAYPAYPCIPVAPAATESRRSGANELWQMLPHSVLKQPLRPDLAAASLTRPAASNTSGATANRPICAQATAN